MTEGEWLVSFDAIGMLTPLRQKLSARKLRLIALSWWRDPFTWRELRGERRSKWELVCGQLISLGEIAIEANTDFVELQPARAKLEVKRPDINYAAWGFAYRFLTSFTQPDAWSTLTGCWEVTSNNDPEAPDHAEYCCSLRCDKVRDIFGNLFRPVTLDPEWRTSTVLALAEGIYADRAFDRLPILADALQDVGCENADLLDHCRDPQLTHVRGCWAVDLMLGKV